MRGHSGGSHNSSAHPDEQMGRLPFSASSKQSKTAKKVAAKKRRQRDKSEGARQ